MHTRGFCGRLALLACVAVFFLICDLRLAPSPNSDSEMGVSISAQATAQGAPEAQQGAEPTPEAQQAESAPESGQYPDGVFTGSGEGYGGDVTVEVTIENGRIASVEILDGSSEDAPYLRDAKAIIPEVIEAQHTNLDAISGATHSTWGILNAIDDAFAVAQEGT